MFSFCDLVTNGGWGGDGTSASSSLQAAPSRGPQNLSKCKQWRVVASRESSRPGVSRRPTHGTVLGVRDSGAQSPQRNMITVPSNSIIVRNIRILYDLCNKEGVFSMFHDCNYFYYCFANVAGCEPKFQQILGVCKEGFSFDETIKDCVPKSCNPEVQNNPNYDHPSPALHDAILPPAPASHQISTWQNEEPEWYSKQPAILKTAPSWYYNPPDWYNNPPTADMNKSPTSQVDQIIKKHD
ncbi:uncharacterized protein LOC135100086 isoform X3 [Scylla paramamosain]|uniref:uncharacterized protein LOC135100086 isoform X3 n=1 Tax=Scylla paramamosain TaxID=85552 RepID=UPI0030827C0E